MSLKSKWDQFRNFYREGQEKADNPWSNFGDWWTEFIGKVGDAGIKYAETQTGQDLTPGNNPGQQSNTIAELGITPEMLSKLKVLAVVVVVIVLIKKIFF